MTDALRRLPTTILVSAMLLIAVRPAAAQGEFRTSTDDDPFQITVVFTDDSLDASQREVVETAAAMWDLVITGYEPGVTLPLLQPDGVTTTSGPVINASVVPGDGLGGNFAIGGPTFAATFAPAGLTVATTGVIEFDRPDLPFLVGDGTLLDTAFHEMGHALGIGSVLWFDRGDGGQVLAIPGSGEYTGEHGLAAYRDEFDPDAAFVPVELTPGAGPDVHWDQFRAGQPLQVSNITGQSIFNEILTGVLTTPTFLSTLTVGSLRDLGYTVDPDFRSTSITALADLANGVPEPSGLLLTLLGVAPLAARRR